MLFGDLREIKSLLQIDPNDNSEDKTLNFYNEWAGSIIEEFLGRDILFKSRVQLYKGTGTQRLLLRNRPVYPAPAAPYFAIQVIVDPQGYFGAASGAFQNPPNAALTYGIDYTLQIDQDDGSSRSGILIRLNNYWTKPQARQVGLLSPFIADDTGSIQITFTAGYSVDTLPSVFRAAGNLLVSRMRYILPLGVELTSESYEDRSISVKTSDQAGLLALVRHLLFPFRNWHF